VFRRHRRDDADRSRHDSDDELEQDGLDEDGLDEDELDEDGLDEDELDEDELDDEPGDADDELAEPAAPRAARRAPSHRRASHDLGDPATWTRMRDSAAAPAGAGQSAGPWDGAGDYPEAQRMDFGSLLVPMHDGFDIQVNLDDQAGMWVAVVWQDSALQLQAFAAPKTSGLWDEVRAEIADEVAKAGGQSQDADGPFGPELLARLTPGGPGTAPVPMRFMGADGPRWFLRGLLTGPAAERPELARPFEELFADVVVVRGDHAAPPRNSLEIQLPDEARQAIEQQMEAEQAESGTPPPGMLTDASGLPVNPFERGPEITETR
jgi:uncharacterized protein DUF3710